METISDSSGVRGSVESLIGGRQENQDSYGMAETRLGMLVAVCDGMGGGPAGKTASSIATQAIIDYVSGASADGNPASVLEDAVVSANEAILAAVSDDPALKGMGTTCVCVLIVKSRAYIVHVGDSRCYHLRGNNVIFRTSDHSYVGELVRRGTMTEEDARTSRYSNVITRAIGAGTDISPEVDEVTWRPGDRFALMSDGIWGTMPEPRLVSLLAERSDPATLVPDIAARVDALGKNNGGGHDNLTLALVDLPGQQQTVNDRFRTDDRKTASAGSPASSRQSEASVARPGHAMSPGQDDSESEYVLEEIEEKESDENKKSHTGAIIWILATALFACIIVIIFLIVRPEKSGDASSSVLAEADTGIIDTRSIRDGSGIISEENDGVEESMHSRSVQEKQNEKTKHVTRETNVKDIKGTSGPALAQTVGSKVNRQLGEAVSELEGLKTFDPKDLSPKDGKARKARRKEIYKKVLKLIEEGGRTIEDPVKNKELQDLCNQIKSVQSRGKIIQVDAKGLSTREANQEIDRYVGLLKHLISQ